MKKMEFTMKRFVLALLAMFTAVTGAFAQSESDFTVTAKNGVLTITGYTGSESEVVIPERINGLPVTAIGEDAFLYSGLTGIIIPDSVTFIGHRAFYKNALTSVTIGNSVTGIGMQAFYGNELTSVTIPDSVTGIGLQAFCGNQLTSVSIGNSVTYIGEWAFYGNKLTSVTIPNSNARIEADAFEKSVRVRRGR